ncbi:L-lactate dehydrogenase (cytochrome) [Fusarium albosuccineum]|uniref:L-lactate dehydrogenase (Cytochrome) n=1 Tax=Fusarium albosuccineum TaxID=1237068 RepID=A0A8H4L833_9HYPO|nr:L-lactate dehydrogenase (cytochrome) [Fusarium albosuccineum]
MAPIATSDIHRDDKPTFNLGPYFIRPAVTFYPSKWESLAEATLPSVSRRYLQDNCDAGSTYQNNLKAFTRWSIVPRRLVPSHKNEAGKELFADTTTRVLGQTLPFPIAVAPISAQMVFHDEGEAATARAASYLGIPFILSTASGTSIEEAALACGTNARWFQLYWPSREHDDITKSLLKRAKNAGYTALFVTLDTRMLGRLPHDFDKDYHNFVRPDHLVQIGLTDLVFQKKFKEKHGYNIPCAPDDVRWSAPDGTTEEAFFSAAREWAKIMFPEHPHSWEDVEFLKQNWDGPIVLKGIQSVHDAKKCVEIGVQGIVVSNHGGQQQEGVGSLSMLPQIVEAVGDKLDIFFDSGIRSGADIIKAIALGAKCVLIGRPYVYGLNMGGEKGVKDMLGSICDDLAMNMHLSGLRDIKEVTRDVLVKESDLL